MRASVVASLASSAVVGVIVAAVACGGGGTTLENPLSMRDTPPSGFDPAPPGMDTAPFGEEAPPPTNDVPPSVGDPANQNGGGTCVPCSGTFKCTDPQQTTETAVITLKPTAKGGCNVSGFSQTNQSNQDDFPACGTGLPTSLSEPGASFSLTRASGGGFKVCFAIDAGTDGISGCVVCIPTSPEEGSGSGSSSSTGVTVSIGGAPPSSSGGGGGCSALSACCSQLSSLDQPSCTDTVNVGNAQACSDALMGFTEENLCN